MTAIVFDPAEFESFWVSINMLEVVKRGIYSGAMRAIPLMQDGGRFAPPASKHGGIGAFNTGRYVGGWRVQKEDWGSTLFNKMPYSGIIEEGRRPGSSMPPKDDIAHWAQRRLGLSKDAAREAAWPMARAIGKRGLLARKVMSSPAMLARVTAVVRDEIAREIAVAVSGGP